MGELALDHLCHGALLQHHDDIALLFWERRSKDIDRAFARQFRQAEIDGIFVDGRIGLPDLADQGQERAGKGNDGVELPALEDRLAQAEKRLGREIDIADPVIGAQNQHRMRQRVQQIVRRDAGGGTEI